MNFTDKLRQLHETSTPGPWDFVNNTKRGTAIIHSVGATDVAGVYNSDSGLCKDASIICLLRNKVPELLELLDAAQQFARITAFIPETHDTIRSNLLRAIAKLEGLMDE
jgi:hypothetical protein